MVMLSVNEIGSRKVAKMSNENGCEQHPRAIDKAGAGA
jgi:hypothetical protein